MLLSYNVRFKAVTSINIMIIAIVFVMASLPAAAEEKTVLLREEFNDLDKWKPLYFKKIKEHTDYSVVNESGSVYLKASSNASASGIIFKEEFNVFEYSKVKWRWKVSNIYEKGNAQKKSGDDYPIRVYIIFKYDPDKASFGRRVKYGLAKAVYGEYPPHSSLNYIWANRDHAEHVIPNPYAKEAMMIILRAGPENAGIWIEEEVDILNDYRKVFGTDPPDTAGLAIMNDSDNTKESAVSYIDYIEVYR